LLRVTLKKGEREEGRRERLSEKGVICERNGRERWKLPAFSVSECFDHILFIVLEPGLGTFFLNPYSPSTAFCAAQCLLSLAMVCLTLLRLTVLLLCLGNS
jgi:hypothetical protein